MPAVIRYLIVLAVFVKANELNVHNNDMDMVPQITFKDYIRKFKPSEVWSDIEDKNKQKGLNKTLKDEFTTMFNGIDETEELLNLTVKNGDPIMVLNKDGRRWKPPGDIRGGYDPFSLRRRLLELMKQAIYQARNKMVVMQMMREKYNQITLYKMGFLIAKTDTTCNTLAGFAYKAFKACSMSRQRAIKSYPIIDKLEANERLLDLWFDVDLLVDLILVNHESCKQMLKTMNWNRKQAWNFTD